MCNGTQTAMVLLTKLFFGDKLNWAQIPAAGKGQTHSVLAVSYP